MKFLRKVLNKEGFSGNSENVSEILVVTKVLLKEIAFYFCGQRKREV